VKAGGLSTVERICGTGLECDRERDWSTAIMANVKMMKWNPEAASSRRAASEALPLGGNSIRRPSVRLRRCDLVSSCARRRVRSTLAIIPPTGGAPSPPPRPATSAHILSLKPAYPSPACAATSQLLGQTFSTR